MIIRARLQIEKGEISDTLDKWGLIYLDADKRTAPPEKKSAASSYAEEAGEHVDVRTVADAFDYAVKFAVVAPNRDLVNANAVIARFNAAIRKPATGSDISLKREITFYNDRDRVKIVGYPELIAEPTSLYRRQDGSVMDCAEVELKIRVGDPTKCDFNLKDNFMSQEPDPNQANG